MREFTKSMMSYTWGMSLFGVQQMVNVMRPPQQGQQHPATEAFNNVAQCTVEQMGDAVRSTYRIGDNVQRGMVDVMFSVFSLGMFNRGGGGGGNRGGWGSGRDFGRQASNIGQQTAEAFRQGMGAMGQAAGGMGQAVGGAASGWGRGGSRQQQQQQQQQQQGGDASTGWGPVPPPGSAG
jgi:hypothetical protein